MPHSSLKLNFAQYAVILLKPTLLTSLPGHLHNPTLTQNNQSLLSLSNYILLKPTQPTSLPRHLNNPTVTQNNLSLLFSSNYIRVYVTNLEKGVVFTGEDGRRGSEEGWPSPF